MSAEADAAKKFLIFTASVLVFLAVKFVAEEWFYVPRSLSLPLGFFVMGMMIKPLAAPDLPMSRWVFAPLVGAAAGLVLLTAPSWYERWTAPDYSLPDFLPTEEDFIARVIYYAEGLRGDKSPRDCGTFGPGSDPSSGRECAASALEAGEAFYFFYFPGAYDSFEREALASFGRGAEHRFHYSRSTLWGRPRARIVQTPCVEPRFLDGENPLVQCGPAPTPAEFREDVGVGRDCGTHSATHPVDDAEGQAQVDCVAAALAAREPFHYEFDSDWGGMSGTLTGVLSWLPSAEEAPTLSFYRSGDDDPEGEPFLVQRTCVSPTIRFVIPTSSGLRRDGTDSSVEVDCGDVSTRSP